MLDSDSVLVALASGKLPPAAARRALGLLLEEARRAGELEGFTSGQRSALLEIENAQAAATALADFLGCATSPRKDDDNV